MFETITIQSHAGPYTAIFENNVFPTLSAMADGGCHFIVDKKVAGLYHDQLENVLASNSALLIEAIESNKSLEKMPAYVEHLVGKSLRRDQTLVAIGGGIIQDITCFLASTMLRGVPWHFYPTTLLAQADSCIGSKSSINCGDAKNILGTFTPPERVTISVPFLDTLEERDVRSGVGEMIKVHVIDGPQSFDLIASDYPRLFTDPEIMSNYIRRSLEIKKEYIEKDEFDRTIRNVFNYGHSFGHAIEAATNFAIPHGIAITIGMDMANFVSWKLGVGSEDNFQRMHPILKSNYSRFDDLPVPLEPFMAAIAKDKKNVGSGSVTLILVDAGGQVSKQAHANDEAFSRFCSGFLETGRSS